MTVTRAQLIERAARRLGGRVGTIASPTTTTAVLNGLINTSGDDTEFLNDRLFTLQSTTEGDKERFIDRWEDVNGKAHFATRASNSTAGDTYVVVPREDYSLFEFRDALNIALRETNKTYRQVIPLAPHQRVIPLGQLTWVTGDQSIDGVWVSENPDLMHNSDFALWHNGDSAAPDGWTAAGGGATIARVATGTHSPYGVSVTRATNNVTLTQSIPAQVREYLTRSTDAPLTPLYAAAWVVSSTASVARIGISNGTSTTYSSYHSGTDGVPELLTVNYTPTATVTDLALVLSVDTTDAEATFYFAGMVASDSGFPESLYDHGMGVYQEWAVPYVTRNIGGLPVIELAAEPGANQLIVNSRRPFAEMDDDTDEVDDQYARALEAGLICKLVQVVKPNQDRTRLDRVYVEEMRIWTRLTDNFIDKPVPTPPIQYVVTGA